LRRSVPPGLCAGSPPSRATAGGARRTATGRTRWRSCRRIGPPAAAACCGWEIRRCCRWSPSSPTTGSVTRSPGTAPATPGSSGGPPPAGSTGGAGAPRGRGRGGAPRRPGPPGRPPAGAAPPGPLPPRPGPGAAAPAPLPRLPAALAGQLDLARLESPPGLALYENTAWISTPGTVRTADASDVPRRSTNPTRAALRADVGGVSAVRGAPAQSTPTGPGLGLWSEALDGAWSAPTAGSPLRHVEAFGWENGFRTTRRASVSINYDGQLRRYGMIALQVALVIALIAVAWRSRVAGRRRPRRISRPSS